ncbi:MAG: hypothetical protein WBP25_12725 [Giesbergeria sp.]|jgi:hypothetical protein
MKPGVVLLIAGLAVGLSITSAAKAGSCPASEALFVEEKLQQLETWAQFSTFYSQHKKCDVDALRYAFTQQVAHLAAKDQGMLGLSKMLAKDPQLKPMILRHLKSEAVTSDDRDQILKALDACQGRQMNICRDVKKMINSM